MGDGIGGDRRWTRMSLPPSRTLSNLLTLRRKDFRRPTRVAPRAPVPVRGPDRPIRPTGGPSFLDTVVAPPMFSGKIRPLSVALLLAVAAPAALLAQRPTAEQAQQLLQSRPDLVRQLRDRIGASGLTPDQVRARLRAEGYPE